MVRDNSFATRECRSMSRRKPLRARYPSGQPISAPRTELDSPTAIRRLADLARDGLRDPLWGSQLGRLHAVGKITSSELAAGKRWHELSASYASACQAPLPPRTKSLDAPGDTPADPDSEAGIREARRHEKASAAYVEGKHALRLAGREAERTVESVCVKDEAVVLFAELESLRAGLSALSAWWTSRKR
jgi:hypothetical protein